jgi:hypothetical protein
MHSAFYAGIAGKTQPKIYILAHLPARYMEMNLCVIVAMFANLNVVRIFKK